MLITEADVLHVARLARLNLNGQEVEALGRELSAILDYMEILKGIDTTGIEPTFNVRSAGNDLREDQAADSQSISDVQLNAPSFAGGTFVVPRVIDQG